MLPRASRREMKYNESVSAAVFESRKAGMRPGCGALRQAQPTPGVGPQSLRLARFLPALLLVSLALCLHEGAALKAELEAPGGVGRAQARHLSAGGSLGQHGGALTTAGQAEARASQEGTAAAIAASAAAAAAGAAGKSDQSLPVGDPMPGFTPAGVAAATAAAAVPGKGRPSAPSAAMRAPGGVGPQWVRKLKTPSGWLPHRGQFLYPLMPYGPNNQMVSLKEVLALAEILNRTVIVPDVRKHSLEKDKSIPWRLPFGDMFDLAHLASRYSLITFAQAKAVGWKGNADAMVLFQKKDYKEMKAVMGPMGIQVSNAVRYDVGLRYDGTCEERVQRIRNATRDHLVSLIVAYQTIVPNAGHGLELGTTGDPCHDGYLEVCRHVVKSPKIVRLATDFVNRRLNGTKFVAVQIRPYPDECITDMLKHGFDASSNAVLKRSSCRNGYILRTFIDQTRTALAAAGTNTLVLFAPPTVRQKLASMYELAGIRPVMYQQQDLLKEFPFVSNTVLGFVEEEIGLRAEVFVGTVDSSITGMIVQERYVHGKPKSSSYTWTHCTEVLMT